MSEHELVLSLDSLGVRTNSAARAKLAAQLHARGVSTLDLRRGMEHLRERQGYPETRAASVLASLVSSDSTWVPFMDEVAKAERDERMTGQPAAATRRGEHENGQGLRITAEQLRQQELRHLGLSETDASLVEIGGYLHARVVGDDRVFGDVAKEAQLDPWDAIHAAAWWADLCGGGRHSLRRALERQTQVRRCSESLLEYLDAVPVRTIDREKPVPDLTGWRAKAMAQRQRALPPPKLRIVRPLTDEEASEVLAALREHDNGPAEAKT